EEPRSRQQEALEVRPWHDRAAQEAGRDDVRGRGSSGQERRLAEEVTGPEGPARFAVDVNRRVALEDDEEAAAGEPLPQHALPLREHLLADRVRPRPQL